MMYTNLNQMIEQTKKNVKIKLISCFALKLGV